MQGEAFNGERFTRKEAVKETEFKVATAYARLIQHQAVEPNRLAETCQYPTLVRVVVVRSAFDRL